MHCIEIEIASRKQVMQRKPLGRCVRVQREIYPLHIHIEILFQLFNTPGTEIAPGSNEVGKNVQSCHSKSICLWYASGYFPFSAAFSAAFFSSRRAPTNVL